MAITTMMIITIITTIHTMRLMKIKFTVQEAQKPEILGVRNKQFVRVEEGQQITEPVFQIDTVFQITDPADQTEIMPEEAVEVVEAVEAVVLDIPHIMTVSMKLN